MNQKAILQLDTNGHTSLINKLIVSSDKRYLISASDDKSIRVWDTKTKNEVKKILGEITPDSGKIFAIALSPNDKYLATAGFLKNNEIRIYDFKSGKLLQLLKSHTNIISDLKFSKDGKFLVSASDDESIKIWEVKSWKLNKAFYSHINYAPKQVEIFKILNEYRILSVESDNKAYLYSLEIELNSFKANHELLYVAISDKFIAICGYERKIYIFDLELNLLQTIESKTKPSGLAFSPNGKYLLSGKSSYPNECNIYETTTFRKISNFTKHNDLVKAVTFLDDEVAITAGGENNEIYFWDIKTEEELAKIEGVGNTIWSVGIKGNLIGFGNSWTASKGQSKLQKCFDLKKLQILIDVNFNEFDRNKINYLNYYLKDSIGGKYEYDDAVLKILQDEKTIATIIRDSTNGYRHRCYSFYKDKIISGGSHGNLIAYNLDGMEIAKFIGHTDDIWSIAIEDATLVSGGSDQIIKLWNLEELDSKSEIYPFLNLFVSKDDEWILWSEEGYYTSSLKGDKYVGYYINRGEDKEAEFFSSDKFFDELYRPNVIEAIVENKNKEITLTSKNKKIKKKVIEKEALPPKVILLSEAYLEIENKDITLEFEIEPKNEIKEIEIFLNGREIKKIKEIKDKYFEKIEINNSESYIQIFAKGKYRSEPTNITIKRKIIEHLPKPNLYILSIGVSEYKNRDYNLKYADSDAEAITRIFKLQEKYLYNRVEVKLLKNQDATKDNILDELDWLEKEVTQKDVAILFLAGHGINDHKGAYYFLNYEVELNRLRRTATKWIEFEDIVKTLPSKVLLLIDTCHAGAIMGNRKRDIVGAIKELMSTGSGQIIMSATTGGSYSLEDEEWEHGVFTKAIIEALEEFKACKSSNKKTITIKDLEHYVTHRVKELTGGEQKPTTIIPESVPDFPIVYKR